MPKIIVPLAEIFGHGLEFDNRKVPNSHNAADLALAEPPANASGNGEPLFSISTFPVLAISLPCTHFSIAPSNHATVMAREIEELTASYVYAEKIPRTGNGT